ncbi:MAG: patatin-like phospholipase family protein, partial [Bacteroidetes bacterium]|nr:patatin-like phospholipase family protein [Bacteroidota bacterium]
MKRSPLSSFPDYTNDLEEVISSEKEYIYQRRLHYGETRPKDNQEHIEDPWGLAISGGGIRAATLALGMMQKFMVEGIFRKFDYMSTVSGGGFMGACLTSLMNTDSEKFVYPDHISPEEAPKLIPGLDTYTSPLVLLMKTRRREHGADKAAFSSTESMTSRSIPAQMVPDDEKEARKMPPLEVMMDYTSADKIKIDARHQVDHLRTHGEYLTPDKSIFSISIQRLVGTFFAGFLHNFTLFLLALMAFVTLNYIVFDSISGHDFYQQITTYQADPENSDIHKELTNQLASIWTDNLAVFLGRIGNLLIEHIIVVAYILLTGFFLGVIAIINQRRITQRVDKMQAKIAKGEEEPTSLAGYNQSEYEESGFMQRFNVLVILGGPVLSILTWLIGLNARVFQPDEYWIIFGLPAIMSIGVFTAIYFILPFLGNPSRQTRFARSFDGALRGSALYGVLISALMPFMILFLFTFSFLFNQLFITLTSSLSSLVSVAVGYFAMTSKPEDGNSMINNLLSKLKIPAISLSVILFIVLIASAITGILARAGTMSEGTYYLPGWLFLGSVVLFLILGSLINANRMSLHYFYRDRLAEAYLKTDGKVKRMKRDMQGMPLVNLRNDEHLKLMDLGWKKTAAATDPDINYRIDDDGTIWEPNPRGPYHLVVTALNLQGSDELVRKDLKSEHFVFSRNYVGAQSTGYVKTSVYREGKTQLARAATISAAAVGSGMGM